MALQFLSTHPRIEVAGKQILFVSDLRQLPPVIPSFPIPAAYPLITGLLYSPSIRTFQLRQLVRAPEATWVGVLLSIAKGQSPELISIFQMIQEVTGLGLTNPSHLCYISTFAQPLFHILPLRLIILGWPNCDPQVSQHCILFADMS
jgi:hypothetical protein